MVVGLVLPEFGFTDPINIDSFGIDWCSRIDTPKSDAGFEPFSYMISSVSITNIEGLEKAAKLLSEEFEASQLGESESDY